MLFRAVALTVGARIVSALLSFGVFSQVASSLAPASAARVLFFSFVFGFCLATLRTFHLVAAKVVGGESRAGKLRRVRAAAQTLRGVMVWTVPTVLVLLLGQGVGWPVAAAGAVVVAFCGQDLDLARSALGRHPVLPLLTAAGGVAALVLLALSPDPSEALCAVAFLVQWVPVVGVQLIFGRRLLPPVNRDTAMSPAWSTRVVNTGGLFLTSIFDGAVLNAPFIFAMPIAAAAAVDLALGNRLFVASLALFSLIASWVISGDIHRLAARASLRPVATFVTLQLVISWATGSAYAVIYQFITGNPVGLSAFVVFLVISLAYVMHATGLRYLVPRLSARVSVIAYAFSLGAFYAMLVWQHGGVAADLRVIVGSVTLALIAPPVVMWALLGHIRKGH